MSNDQLRGYQRQHFVFRIAQEVREADKEKVREVLQQLANSRSWVLGPPRFFEFVDDSSSQFSVDSDESAGGELEIYSALGPLALPRDIDQMHLEEVESLVGALRKISEEADLSFEFELGGVYVGAIDGGVVNSVLQEGLIDEWRKHIVAIASPVQ